METKKYKTKDFYLSACILASGYPLLQIERTSEKFSIFTFDISAAQAEKIIQNHWNYSLTLSTRKFVEAINELKTRLYNGQSYVKEND